MNTPIVREEGVTSDTGQPSRVHEPSASDPTGPASASPSGQASADASLADIPGAKPRPEWLREPFSFIPAEPAPVSPPNSTTIEHTTADPLHESSAAAAPARIYPWWLIVGLAVLLLGLLGLISLRW